MLREEINTKMSFEELQAMSNDDIALMCSYMFSSVFMCGTTYYNWEENPRCVWSNGRNRARLIDFYERIFEKKLLKGFYVDRDDNEFEFPDTFENIAQYWLSSEIPCDFIEYNWTFGVTEYWLQSYTDLTKIEIPIEEYREQKEERDRLERERLAEIERKRIEAQRKLLLPWLIESMTRNINWLNNTIKKNLTQEILTYQINILKSKWLIVPCFVRAWLIYCEWYNPVKIELMDIKDIKMLYKALLLEDFELFWNTLWEKVYIDTATEEERNSMVADCERYLETRSFDWIDMNAICRYLFDSGRTDVLYSSLTQDWTTTRGRYFRRWHSSDSGLSTSYFYETVRELIIKLKIKSWQRIKIRSTWYEWYVVWGNTFIVWRLINVVRSDWNFIVSDWLSKKRYENSLKKLLPLDITAKIKELEATVDNSVSDMAKQKIERLAKDTEIEDMRFDDWFIVLRTVPLYINQFYNNRKNYKEDMLIGRFLIKISMNNPWTVRVIKSYPMRTVQAPHIYNDGHFCTWEFNQLMADSAREYNFIVMLHYTIQHLTTFNANSPLMHPEDYQNTIEWELSDLEREWFPRFRPITWFSLWESWWFITPNE